MSLDSVILLNDIENQFGIEISNEEASRIFTVQDLANCVFENISFRLDTIEIHTIEEKVIKIISESQGIPITEIELTHHLVNDLGID